MVPSAQTAQTPETQGFCRLFSADWWLISCALLTLVFVPAVSSLGIVGFIACVAAVTWRNPGLALRSIARYSPILLFSLYALASAAWSDDPEATVKQGLELLLTAVCCIIILRRIAGSDLASALLGPSFILCIACMIRQPSAFQGAPLQGFIPSKNLFAFLAQTLLASSIAVLLDKRFNSAFRLFALVGFVVGVLDVALARSAGAWVTSVLFVFTFLAFRLSQRFSLGVRVSIGIAAMAITVVCAFSYKSILSAAQNFQINVLHKDVTLTGRTEMWEFSRSLIAERPIFGHGYSAFWREGNLDAEALWRQMGIATRSGFNFHNQFIEVTIDLGYVGLVIFVVALVWVAAVCLWSAIRRPSVAGAFLTAILVALYARLPVESILIGPWNTFFMLWLAIAVQSLSPIGEATPKASNIKDRVNTRRKRLTPHRPVQELQA